MNWIKKEIDGQEYAVRNIEEKISLEELIKRKEGMEKQLKQVTDQKNFIEQVLTEINSAIEVF